MIGVVNVLIRMVFRLRLEIFSFKIRIYMIIMVFFLLSVLVKLHFKLESYVFRIRLKEI
jgi:hypothetical protein